MDLNTIIQTISVYAIPVIFAITLHEAAHGYVAKYFGDSTAYIQGRVSLNPLKHIDPIGTIVMPLVVGIFSGFLVGYAKPVPVNFENLRHPKRDMIWVALAGPGANLIQALLWALFGVLITRFGVREEFFVSLSDAGITINCVLIALNLLPIPPLDGSRVVAGLLPTRASIAYSRIEPYGFFIVLALLITHVLDLWMRPIVAVLATLLVYMQRALL
jgi:Zn-dependent protease